MNGAISQLIAGKKLSTPPVWLMRQAGRYLPEYQQTRAAAGSFLNLCYQPDLAMKVTLQPLERFPLSAAIIFSDILLIPEALGMKLSFTDGEGPCLDTDMLDKIIAQGFNQDIEKNILAHLSPVLTAITLTRANLAQDKDLIGFAGAPFTLFCYMVNGRSSHNFCSAIDFAITRPADFQKIIALLTKAIIVFLRAQLIAGANLVQLFDSWAGLIPPSLLDIACHQPHQQIIAAIKPVITFPRGHQDIIAYHQKTKATIIALDQHHDMAMLAQKLPEVIFQGNLDPKILTIGGEPMKQAVKKLMTAMGDKSYIFNLGHGIDKATPPDHVAHLLNLIHHFA